MENYWEYIAVFFGIIYVLLAARGNVYCWPAGILSSLIYIGINVQHTLYQDAVLQTYYVLAGVYGWWHWGRAIVENKVFSIKLSQHFLWIVSGLFLVPIFGYVFAQFGNALSYLDAAVMIFSFIATWLTAQKIIENWLYWIVIDVVAAVMYSLKGLQPTVFLYLIYTSVAIYGYYQWRKLKNEDKTSLHNGN